MGSLSNFAQNEILDDFFGNGAYTPSAMYVALLTAAPDEDDTSATLQASFENFEVGNYLRVLTTSADWDVAALGAITNGAAITFAAADGTWTAVTHFAICDVINGVGNMLLWGALSVSKTVTSGDIVEFAIGDIDVTLT